MAKTACVLTVIVLALLLSSEAAAAFERSVVSGRHLAWLQPAAHSFVVTSLQQNLWWLGHVQLQGHACVL